jgi:hypothetical protein
MAGESIHRSIVIIQEKPHLQLDPLKIWSKSTASAREGTNMVPIAVEVLVSFIILYG